MIDYTRSNILCMCKCTHMHGSINFVGGVLYRASEFYFSSYYYYELSDYSNNFLGNISKDFFINDFVEVDICINEVGELFNSIMDGDVVII